MTQAVQIFNNPDFGDLRIVDVNGNSWFVGKDVATSLGYTNPPKALRDHVPDKFKLTERIVLSGQNREVTLINEAGLYKLVMRSKLPNAEKFSDWVCEEVLPSIRKNGVYMTVQAAEEILYNPDFIIGLAKQVKEAQAKIAELEPKADYFDEVLESTSTLLTTTIAKAYGMSGKAFNKLLAECEIQYYCGGCWHLKQPYAKLGYVEYETLKIGHITRQQMKWTEKGRYFLYSSLKKKGILPIREREEVMTELWGA